MAGWTVNTDMGYILLLIVALMWSFVGVLVKSASFMASSSIITISRFSLGIVFLLLLMAVLKKKVSLNWSEKWIWIGAIGKSCNYIFENLGISTGHAYGNVLVWPVQTIFIIIVAILFFKEEMFPRKIMAMLLCLLGILLVSFGGESLSAFLNAGFVPLVLFTFAALGSSVHLISLKKLIGTLDSANMNLNIFLLCTVFMSFPLPLTAHLTGQVNFWAIASLLGLGFISGVSFYFNSEALKKVPFLSAILISNLCILFTPFWAWLFFNEDINLSVISGAVVLIVGIVLANLPRNISIKTLINAKYVKQPTSPEIENSEKKL